MAYAVVGRDVKKGGEVVDHGTNHRDACLAAKERAKSDIGASPLALDETVFAFAALDFSDAGSFVEVVDPLEERKRQLAATPDVVGIEAVLEKSDADLTQDARTVVRAKKSTTFLRGVAGVEDAAPGQWIVLFPRGSKNPVGVFDEKAFRAQFAAFGSADGTATEIRTLEYEDEPDAGGKMRVKRVKPAKSEAKQ